MARNAAPLHNVVCNDGHVRGTGAPYRSLKRKPITADDSSVSVVWGLRLYVRAYVRVRC